jgi:pilus assembly protein CpaF
MSVRGAAAAVREQLRRRLDQLERHLSDEELRVKIEEAVFAYAQKDSFLTAGERNELVRDLFNSIRGLDLLQPLVDDGSITEIMVNGYRDIFIERQGQVERYPGQFESEERLLDLIQFIVGKVNRMVNESSPIVDARLKDGSRVNIVLPPIALHGPTLTIRKFPEHPLTMEQLIARGAISEEAAQLLSRLVKAKYNIFICGGTGSGKTTFLNALASCIPDDERIVTIEDSAELQIRSVPNLVSLETRNANMEGKGEISIRQLIRASLRMRPNRIIVGEVRGAEALDMLQAMNTGHDGSLSTGHANSVQDMMSRLETMVLSGVNFPLEAIRRQIASAIDIVVYISRWRDRSRRVSEITEVAGYRDGDIVLNPLFRFEEEGGANEASSGVRAVRGSLVRTGNALKRDEKLKKEGLWTDSFLEAGAQ